MRTSSAERTWSAVIAAIVLALAMAGWSTPSLQAQAGTVGQWRTLTNQVPINPVHVALMNNGKVLIVAGSGNVATETNFQAAVWDPASETFQTQPVAGDMFCNGMVTLHDGRVFINGGNLQYDPFFGESPNAVYDLATGLFTDVHRMAHGRWYPTVTTLGEGSVMTFSGLLETGGTKHQRRDLHRRVGVERGVSRMLDFPALSADAPEHGWSRARNEGTMSRAWRFTRPRMEQRLFGDVLRGGKRRAERDGTTKTTTSRHPGITCCLC